MKDLVNILLLEDNPNDAILEHNQVLKSGIKHKWLHVSDWDGYVEAILNFKPDVILSDYNLGSFTGIDALDFAKKNCPLVPFIIVTGTLNEETAAETIKMGAWDYIVKERLTRLNTAIINTLNISKEKREKNKTEEELHQSNNFNNYLLKTIPFGMDIVDESGTILFQSDKLKKLVGEDGVGRKCWELYRDDKTQCSTCPLNKGINIGETDVYESHNVLGGKIFEVNHTGIMFNGKKAMLEIFQDITERKEKEKELEIFNDASVDREIKINELRKEVNELRKELGKNSKYDIVT